MSYIIIILKMNWKWCESNDRNQISGTVPKCFLPDRGKTQTCVKSAGVVAEIRICELWNMGVKHITAFAALHGGICLICGRVPEWYRMFTNLKKSLPLDILLLLLISIQRVTLYTRLSVLFEFRYNRSLVTSFSAQNVRFCKSPCAPASYFSLIS